LREREITYDPFKDCLLPKVSYTPNIKNKQIYSDDENSKPNKLSRKMHSFVIKKEKKDKRKVYLGN
jgi:hypothetical protein